VKRPTAIPTLLAGFAVMALAQLAAPLGSPPVYDGVVVQEPYRYLAPVSGQAGSPSSFTSPFPIKSSLSPQFVAATSENPPQAELIGASGAVAAASSVTSMTVSIEPIAVPPSSSKAQVAGNAYRFSITDPSGAPLAINPSVPPTLILRAPDGYPELVLARSSGGDWEQLPTSPSGQSGLLYSNVTALGDFALVVPAATSSGPDPKLIVAGAAALVGAALLVGFLVIRRRSAIPSRAARPDRRPRPSKRRRGGSRRGGRR